MVLMVKNLPLKQEIQLQSLGREDPLEKAMASHVSILSWRIPRTEEPSELQSMGSQESETIEQLTPLLSICILVIYSIIIHT